MGARARGLDFLVIGAVKAGTTSLHEHLRTHPQLYLPPGKEHQFFNWDDVYLEGWDPFAARVFDRVPADRLWGKVSPPYLGGPVWWHPSTARNAGTAAHVVTARRIADAFPDLKLLVLLRDPVERAISSHWESVRRGDRRSLNDAIAEELSPAALESARAQPAPEHCHVVAGEYGRLLKGWLQTFPESQLFIGSTHVLDRDPGALLRDIFRFLSVDESHVPPSLGKQFNTRSPGRRIEALRPAVVTNLVQRTPGLRHAWDAMPARARDRLTMRFRAVAYRIDMWNRVAVADSEELGAALLARLREHYRADLELLATLVGPVSGVTDRHRHRPTVSR